jgi:hypothetical protein
MRHVRVAEKEAAKAADLLAPQLHALLRETQGAPITPLICAADAEGRNDPNLFDMDRAVTLMAALVVLPSPRKKSWPRMRIRTVRCRRFAGCLSPAMRWQSTMTRRRA